jgi:hypothetical protein
VSSHGFSVAVNICWNEGASGITLRGNGGGERGGEDGQNGPCGYGSGSNGLPDGIRELLNDSGTSRVDIRCSGEDPKILKSGYSIGAHLGSGKSRSLMSRMDGRRGGDLSKRVFIL